MLLQEIKNIFHKELVAVYPFEEINSFFYLLIEHYLNLPRFILATEPNYAVTKQEEQPLFEALQKLVLEIPLQHIIGVASFMDMEFKVNKNVLIPRPETEELVRWIVEDNKKNSSPITILDIGTGSGCIAISLAKNLPQVKVHAIDVSESALEVARENTQRNKTNITFHQADILKLNTLEIKFDIIVSNPPYVRELEKKEISNNVKNNEPHLALFVADKNPLVFYKTIVDFAQDNLKQGGSLYFEINQYLGNQTKQLLDDTFSDIELRKDMFGNDRMLKGVLK